MRRKRRQNNTLKLAMYSALLAGAMGGMGYAVYLNHGKSVPDKQGCFDEVPQSRTVMIVDASPPRFDAAQARAIRHYVRDLYNALDFNERLSVYTSEGDQLASIQKSRFEVCGQAQSAEQLTAINAEAGNAGYLAKQRERFFEKNISPQLEALLTSQPAINRLQLFQSPIMEMIVDASRQSLLMPGTKLVVLSDLVQNSDSARFCHVKMEMPPFRKFRQKSIYQNHLKPQSLEGVEVDVLILQRHPSHYEPYCQGEGEVRTFWRDYFIGNGVRKPNFIRIRQGS